MLLATKPVPPVTRVVIMASCSFLDLYAGNRRLKRSLSEKHPALGA
jgi:hypothetical protein